MRAENTVEYRVASELATRSFGRDAPATLLLDRVSVTEVLSARLMPVATALVRLHRSALAAVGATHETDVPHAEVLLAASNSQVGGLVERVIASEIEQLSQLVRAASSVGLTQAPLRLLPDCEGDPRVVPGRVRGFDAAGQKLVFRPGNNEALRVFNTLSTKVFRELGASYASMSVRDCPGGVLVDFVDELEVGPNDNTLFSAGVLIGVAELTRTIDLHDQNVVLGSDGWVVIDAETTLTIGTPPRFVEMCGTRADIVDTPLGSSLLPLWMRQIPTGLGFRSGIMGSASTDDAASTAPARRLRLDPRNVGAIVEGYNALLSNESVADIVASEIATLVGQPVRVAMRPSAEYGLYRHHYIEDCVMGLDADARLRARLSRGRSSTSQEDTEVLEIRCGGIPRFERTVQPHELGQIQQTMRRMRRMREMANSLIRAAIETATLADLGRIEAACRGNFDAATRAC